MIDLALLSLRPNAKWILNGDSYSGLEWLDEDQSKPSEQEVDQEIVRIKAAQDAVKYKSLRAEEYPSIGDQLDALFHAGVFPAEMAAQIQAIKDKYPKA